MSTKHTPENTVRVSIERVVIPAGHEVIRDGRRVRLEGAARAWQFTIPSSRASLGVDDHNVLVEVGGAWACCSCAASVNRDRCTLVDNPTAILRHHGLLPPAAPGGAVGEPPEPAVLAECEDAARDERKRRHAEAMRDLYGDLARDEATLRRGYPADEVERILGA